MPDRPRLRTTTPSAPLRIGHSTETPGLVCLYLETGGGNYKLDRRVGVVEGADLAVAIAEAWNAFYGLTPRAATGG